MANRHNTSGGESDWARHLQLMLYALQLFLEFTKAYTVQIVPQCRNAVYSFALRTVNQLVYGTFHIYKW